MSELREFRLPDLGEGLTEGEIIGWLVAEGDTVRLNQPIVEVETAKAAVEVPSPYAGRVVRLHHDAGSTVDVGSPIITVDTAPEDAPGDVLVPAAEAPPVPSASPADLVPTLPDAQEIGAGLTGGAAPGGRTAVLVGYGPRTTTGVRRARKAAATASVGVPVAPPSGRAKALAKPPVRKLARDLGVDLTAIAGSGAGGIVTRADVQAATTPVAQTFSGDTRIPVKGVRKLTAQNMVASAFTAPHVTEFLTCDVTATSDLVGRLRTLPDFAATRVTPLLLVAKALLVACRRHPGVNASWDEPAQEIVLHAEVNLGIAAATPRGLLVPNIKGAGSLDLPGLAQALTTLTTTAREGKTPPADLAGGTITITNVGVFGVDTGTPILNPGEAAILCVGVIRPTPWVVDGQLGSEFLADIGAMLSDPTRLLAWS